MDAETAELLHEVSAALRWARFGGVTHVEARLPAAAPPTDARAHQQAPSRPASSPASNALGLRPGGRLRTRFDASSPPAAAQRRQTAARPAAAKPAPAKLDIVAHPTGDPASPLTLLCSGRWGDGPGACWQGPEGELLRRMIAAMKLDPATVHAVTLVRVPEGESVAPDQRPPSLAAQLKQASPAAMLVFGERAAHWLLRTDQPIDTLRGQWRTLGGVPTMTTYGPRLLLQMPMFKAMAWKDMQDVMARIERGSS